MNAPSIRSLLEKPRRAHSAPELALPVERDTDNSADYEPFARGLIGNRPQLVLLFRKAKGAIRGFSYSYFYGIQADDPASGFTIDFTHCKVTVSGKNLGYLFRLVCEQRVAEIAEFARSGLMETINVEPVVEAISIRE